MERSVIRGRPQTLLGCPRITLRSIRATNLDRIDAQEAFMRRLVIGMVMAFVASAAFAQDTQSNYIQSRLSDPIDHPRGAVPGRRRRRHRRPHRRREIVHCSPAAGHHRQSRQRRRHPGRARGREGGARRLHAAARPHRHDLHQSQPLRQCGLRPAHRLRADRPDRHHPDRPRGASLAAGAARSPT